MFLNIINVVTKRRYKLGTEIDRESVKWTRDVKCTRRRISVPTIRFNNIMLNRMVDENVILRYRFAKIKLWKYGLRVGNETQRRVAWNKTFEYNISMSFSFDINGC